MIISDHQLRARSAFGAFGGVRGAPSTRPRATLRQLAALEGRRLSQGLAQVAYLAGGLSAFFDAAQPRGARGVRGRLGGLRRQPGMDFRRVAFASGFGAYDLDFGASADGAPGASGLGYMCDSTGACYNEAPGSNTFDNFLKAYPDSVHGPAGAARVAVLAVAWAEERKWADGALPRAVLTYQQARAGDTVAQQTVVRSVAYWHAAGYPALPVDVRGGVSSCDYHSALDSHRGASGRNPPVCGAVSVSGELLIEDPGANGSCPTTDRPTVALDAGGALQIVPGGSGMQFSCLGNVLAQTVGALRAMEACRGVPEPSWFKNAMNRARVQDPQWRSQCQRNFPRKAGACLWDDANRQYWDCMGTDTSLMGDVARFFNDAWDLVTKKLDACFGFDADFTPHVAKPPYECLHWLANTLPQPLGFLFTLILEVPKLVSCTAAIFESGPIEEKVQCFIDVLKESIRQVVNTLNIPFDVLVIAGNAAVGNIPGAVVAGAQYVVKKISDAVTDPEAKAVLKVVASTSELVVVVMAQGPGVFKTEAFWQMFGALIQNVAPGTTLMAAMGRALARNAEIPAMALRGEDVVAHVRKKWLDPAIAMVQTAARSGAVVMADLGGDGDVFRDLDVLLRSVADIFDGVGDGINAVKILGTAGQELKHIAANLRKAAITVLKAGKILDQAKNVVGAASTLTREQIEAEIKAAVDKALADLSQGQVPSIIGDIKDAADNFAASTATVQACLQAESAGLTLTEPCRMAFCAAIAAGNMNPAFVAQYRCTTAAPAAPTYVGREAVRPTQQVPGGSIPGGGSIPPEGRQQQQAPPADERQQAARSGGGGLALAAVAAGLLIMATR